MGRYFYSTAVCFYCKYNLFEDPKGLLRTEWDEATGCPCCNRSFL